MAEDKKNKEEEIKNSKRASSKDSLAEESVEKAVESQKESTAEASKTEAPATIETAATEESTKEKSEPETKETSIEKLSEQDKNNDLSNNNLKLPFIIGKKIGMSQLFSDNGTVLPVTIVEAGPCYISQLKTDKDDGYAAIQLAYGEIKKNNKPLEGHFKNASIPSKKYLKEFRYSNIDKMKLGSEVNLTQYNVGDFVNVTGYSKGKGFAGHMKRHNFSGGRASHGKNSVMRKAGSVGAGTDPGKVWKGTRMAGRMGNDKITVKNIQVVRLDESKNLIFLRGAVPGSNNKIVYLNKSNIK